MFQLPIDQFMAWAAMTADLSRGLSASAASNNGMMFTKEQFERVAELAQNVGCACLACGMDVTGMQTADFCKLFVENAHDVEGMKGFPPAAVRSLHALAMTISNTIHTEAMTKVALLIYYSDVEFWKQRDPLFGKAVADKLPDMAEDIEESGKCLATQRYTASVFHLMRVMESAVEKFAGLLNIEPIDSRGKDKGWQNFLNEANKAIRLLPQDTYAKRLDGISAHLYHVKSAWRNETMHPKATYTREQALAIFAAVKAFVSDLSELL